MEQIDDQAVRDLFIASGALLTGHFLLSSGRHSAQYLEKFRLVEKPRVLEPLCREVARRCKAYAPQFVLGPTTAGIILAYSVANHLGIEARFAEPSQEGRALRRGQHIPAGARVLVVDDILTTGLSVRECLAIVEDCGAEAVAVAVLADRSGGAVQLGTSTVALLTEHIPSYAPEECPLCQQGVPLVKPGSRSAGA